MSNFHVGQHVVCIDTSEWDRSKVTELPVKGRVYTIRAIETSARWPACSHADGNLRIEEIRCEPIDASVPVCRAPCCGGEYWLQHYKFRPLKKLKVENFTNVDEPVSA